MVQEMEHLKQFNLTPELHLQQLFRSIIYVDLQKHVPDIAQQLRYFLSLYLCIVRMVLRGLSE